MKIVFLTHEGHDQGGAQMCLFDLIKGIHTQYPQAQMYLIANSEGSLVERCRPYLAGYKITPFRSWMFLNPHKAYFKKLKMAIRTHLAQKKVARYLQTIHPDIGITNTITVPQLAMACKAQNIKHVWFLHEIPMLSWATVQFLYSLPKTLSTIDRLSQKIVVPSEFARQYYLRFIDADKLHTIAQAVAHPPQKPEDRPSDRPYTLLSVGQLEPNKGQLELLQAIKKIKDQGAFELRCYLVGWDQGAYADRCRQYIGANGLEHWVTIVPFTSNVAQYYHTADVLVGCSTLETFGRVVVEAQLHQMPVILANTGAYPERITNGVNGLLYEKGNPDDLVRQIEFLQDPHHRAAFVQNMASLDMEQYTHETFSKRFMGVLEQVACCGS